MDAVQTNNQISGTKNRFKQLTDQEKKKILEEKDKKNTQDATKRYFSLFEQFIEEKKLPKALTLKAEDLAAVLEDFYYSVQPVKKDGYCMQTLKCIRAALNRVFRKEKGFDIAKDKEFNHANEVFHSVCATSKKAGRGATKSTVKITQIDLERIAEYFNYDHMTKPDPKRLQQTIIFYIIYFFCRRGRENLYSMKKDTFSIHIEPDGTEYVYQTLDEMDKNHGIDDTKKNKQGRMYATNGKKIRNPSISVETRSSEK